MTGIHAVRSVGLHVVRSGTFRTNLDADTGTALGKGDYFRIALRICAMTHLWRCCGTLCLSGLSNNWPAPGLGPSGGLTPLGLCLAPTPELRWETSVPQSPCLWSLRFWSWHPPNLYSGCSPEKYYSVLQYKPVKLGTPTHYFHRHMDN